MIVLSRFERRDVDSRREVRHQRLVGEGLERGVERRQAQHGVLVRAVIVQHAHDARSRRQQRAATAGEASLRAHFPLLIEGRDHGLDGGDRAALDANLVATHREATSLVGLNVLEHPFRTIDPRQSHSLDVTAIEPERDRMQSCASPPPRTLLVVSQPWKTVEYPRAWPRARASASSKMSELSQIAPKASWSVSTRTRIEPSSSHWHARALRTRPAPSGSSGNVFRSASPSAESIKAIGDRRRVWSSFPGPTRGLRPTNNSREGGCSSPCQASGSPRRTGLKRRRPSSRGQRKLRPRERRPTPLLAS